MGTSFSVADNTTFSISHRHLQCHDLQSSIKTSSQESHEGFIEPSQIGIGICEKWSVDSVSVTFLFLSMIESCKNKCQILDILHVCDAVSSLDNISFFNFLNSKNRCSSFLCLQYIGVIGEKVQSFKAKEQELSFNSNTLKAGKIIETLWASVPLTIEWVSECSSNSLLT